MGSRQETSTSVASVDTVERREKLSEKLMDVFEQGYSAGIEKGANQVSVEDERIGMEHAPATTSSAPQVTCASTPTSRRKR
jgi:hypothetical protein